MTQKELSVHLGFPNYKKISSWETGEVYPKIPDLISISEFFGISISELIGLDDSDPLLPPPTFANAEEEKIAFGKMLDIERSLLHLAERLEQNTQEREAIKREIKLHELALVGLRAQSANQPPPE